MKMAPSSMPMWDQCSGRLGTGRIYFGHSPTTMLFVGLTTSLSRREAGMRRGSEPKHRLYTGSRPDLKGKMALVVQSDHPDVVLAQFDYANNGHLNLVDPLCHGWHRFPALAFKNKRLRGKR